MERRRRPVRSALGCGKGRGLVRVNRLAKMFRFVLHAVAVIALSGSFAMADDTQRGPLFSLYFSGSANQPGKVFKLNPSAGFRFSNHFEFDAGIPFYFVRPTDTGIAEGFSSNNGVGDAYLNLRFYISRPHLYFSSTARGTAPTGNTSDGFSTGRATFDWSNYIEKDAGRFSPFGNVGIANTISDTNFFNRPFTSLGIVGHFEGGTYFEAFRHVRLAGSAYAITPSGGQKVYSKLQRHSSAANPGNAMRAGKANGNGRVFETSGVTAGDARILQDHGYSGWLDLRPSTRICLEFGYSRSVGYALNTLFFSIGIDIGSMLPWAHR